MNTTDPRPTCGHEDCETWYAVDLGWVTYCGYVTASALELEVVA
jgi:hypothetical protein